MRVRQASLILLLCLVGCTAKHSAQAPTPPTPPPPVRSQIPPSTVELILVKHCVITQQENANTVSCACEPVTTIVDKEGGGRRTLVCKKMKPEVPTRNWRPN
jgi:hypothetical protein